MLKISQQQISERWDTLPDSLREALYSSAYGEIIWEIGAKNHLDNRKIGIIAGIAGYVVFGFLHPEDIAQEIRESLGLNSELANSIAAEIDRKIFTPIRSDLEKVYAPAVAEALAGKPAVAEEAMAARPPAEEALDLRKIEESEERKAKSEERKVEVEPPIPGVPPVERLEAAEGPVIIHKEAEFKPLSETKKSLGGLFGFLRKGKEEKISPVKAEIEIGLDTKVREITPEAEREITRKGPSEPPKVRVVHYTEFPTPVSPFGKTKEEVEADKPARQRPEPQAMAGGRGTTRIIEAEERGKVEEISPPENLPVKSEVEPPIKTEPEAGLIKETKKPVKSEAEPEEIQIPKVEEKIQPLDLRKPPAAADSAFVATSAKEAAALAARPEESKPTKPEEEEIIDLSSFK